MRTGRSGGVYGTTFVDTGVLVMRTSKASVPFNRTTVMVSVSAWVLFGALSVMVSRNTGSSDASRVRTVVPGAYESMG